MNFHSQVDRKCEKKPGNNQNDLEFVSKVQSPTRTTSKNKQTNK